MDIITFKLFLSQDGKKPRRPSTIRLHIETISRLLKVSPTLSWSEISRWLISLQEQGRKGTYLNHYIDVLHLWGKCFKRDDLLALDYFFEEEAEKVTMPDADIEAILALPPVRKGPKEAAHYYKWTLFFKILAFTGMRPGELAHMTVDRCDFGERVFYLRAMDVKTNKPRYVAMSDRFYNELYIYVQNLKDTYLFRGKHNGSYTCGAPVFDNVDWDYNFTTRRKRAGILYKKGLSTYSLRHSLITRLLDEDVSLFKVQKQVGHARIDTTAHYYHNSKKAQREALKKDPMSRTFTPIAEVQEAGIQVLLEYYRNDPRLVVSIDRNTEGHVKLDIKETKSPPPVGYDPPMRVSPHDLTSADDELPAC